MLLAQRCRGQGEKECRQPLEAESYSQMLTSKEMGSTFLNLKEVNSGNDLNEHEYGLICRTSR